MASNGMMIHGGGHYRTGQGIDRRRIITFSCLYMGTALDFSDHQVYQALYHNTMGDNAWILGTTELWIMTCKNRHALEPMVYD